MREHELAMAMGHVVVVESLPEAVNRLIEGLLELWPTPKHAPPDITEALMRLQRAASNANVLGTTQAVFPTEADPTGPFFAYTVGLHDRGHPEFILCGLDHDTAHHVLRELAVRVISGETFKAGRYADVLAGDYEVELRPVPRTTVDSLLRVAQAHAKADVDAFQVFWPGDDGRLPPDCEQKYIDMQELER